MAAECRFTVTSLLNTAVVLGVGQHGHVIPGHHARAPVLLMLEIRHARPKDQVGCPAFLASTYAAALGGQHRQPVSSADTGGPSQLAGGAAASAAGRATPSVRDLRVGDPPAGDRGDYNSGDPGHTAVDCYTADALGTIFWPIAEPFFLRFGCD
ncbi:uncharacterized protein LOC124615638 [Schistocerca americana]|uniref:uncharacterized protein LOC124615638 n=1 Tax=Schistocerca americana TaxID=7009 RepID=UPI001F4F606F|nr:uncharacterized protein LOC124615638 [Schistocerca americana]